MKYSHCSAIFKFNFTFYTNLILFQSRIKVIYCLPKKSVFAEKVFKNYLLAIDWLDSLLYLKGKIYPNLISQSKG